MGRLTWHLLRQVAWNWTWAWRNLVPDGKRREWARIAAAMSARSLHLVDWDQGEGPIPAWVPCAPCGGTPCRMPPQDDYQGDVYVARLHALLNNAPDSTEEHRDGPADR